MAESKKSFVLYNDYEDVFAMLTDEEAGKLIKHILAHVNDKKPEMEDRILKVAFEPIKLQLKRDAEKYEKMVERNRENGLRGGAPKGNKNAKKQPKQPKQPNGLNGLKKQPKQADTDTDTDTATDMKESEAHTQIAESTNPDFIKFNKWIKVKAPFCSNPKNFTHQITEAEFLRLKKKYSGQQIADIVEKIENRKDLRKRYSNLYLTVNNWIKKEADNG